MEYLSDTVLNKLLFLEQRFFKATYSFLAYVELDCIINIDR